MYHIRFGVVLEVSVVPPETGNPFHQSDNNVVESSVEVDDVEDSVVAKIVLQPASLSLTESKK